jgi:NADH-quinone oxidoreductase subunit A
MITDFIPIFVLLAVALGYGVVTLTLGKLLGPKSDSPVKGEPYESGKPLLGDAYIRFSVKFYLIAVLFILFDIEVVFLYPWAVVFKDMLASGGMILLEMMIFVGLLAVGYIYLWKKGAFEWE